MTPMPATRQSNIEVAACPQAYVEIVINGRTQPESIPSERGTEIHDVMSEYVRHCARYKIQADWKYFNSLTIAAGPVAGPILDGLRDRYRVNWETVFGTEVKLMLDENFNPCAMEKIWGVWPQNGIAKYSLHEDAAAYTGTLDVIEISPDGKSAKIPDYKSHPSPFEADTYQSVLYPFMLFKHLPQLESIIFELVFVRYQNCTRSVEWKRIDMPEMQAIISRGRERERIIRNHPDQAKALPVKVCTYCPLMKDLTCPIIEVNEYAVAAVDRLIAVENARRLIAFHLPILKAQAEVHPDGVISFEDGLGRRHEYGHLEVPTTVIALTPELVRKLDAYTAATGEDWHDWRLRVGSTELMGKLNANKRKPARGDLLKQLLEEGDIDGSQTKPAWAVRIAGEGIEEDFKREDVA